MKDYTEAVKMYESGLSIQEVASFYAMSRQGMWDILRRRTKLRSNIKLGKDNRFHRGGPVSGRKRAGHIVEKAIKKGILVPPSACESCKGKRIFRDHRRPLQAHHDDYNQPLAIRWLCQPCHHEWHKNNKPIPLGGL